MSKSNTADMLRRIEMKVAELGMTKEEFYEKSGISSASYSQWNTGTHAPTKKKMAQAAAALNVSLEYILTGETKKEPAPTNGNGLSDEVIQIARDLEAAAPEVRNMVKAVLEKSYKPEVGVKVVEVVCPLTGRTEQIHQPYYVYNGKRLPEKNNGCDQCYKCPECELCQMRVMRTVMEGEE